MGGSLLFVLHETVRLQSTRLVSAQTSLGKKQESTAWTAVMVESRAAVRGWICGQSVDC